jgi:hypothetical protein
MTEAMERFYESLNDYDKFYTALKNLDWFYYYSDDAKKYQLQRDKYHRIEQIAKDNGWSQLFNDYRDRVYAYVEVPVDEREEWVKANPYPLPENYS